MSLMPLNSNTRTNSRTGPMSLKSDIAQPTIIPIYVHRNSGYYLVNIVLWTLDGNPIYVMIQGSIRLCHVWEVVREASLVGLPQSWIRTSLYNFVDKLLCVSLSMLKHPLRNPCNVTQTFSRVNVACCLHLFFFFFLFLFFTATTKNKLLPTNYQHVLKFKCLRNYSDSVRPLLNSHWE